MMNPYLIISCLSFFPELNNAGFGASSIPSLLASKANVVEELSLQVAQWDVGGLHKL